MFAHIATIVGQWVSSPALVGAAAGVLLGVVIAAAAVIYLEK